MSEILDQSRAQADDSRTLHLVSSEGESFDVPVDVARMSVVVGEMINDDVQDDEEGAQDIPLPNVKSVILSKVIEFMHHHRLEPMNEIEKVSSLHFSMNSLLFFNISYSL
jgi:S-phase kinase-associated protein 1